MQVLRWRIERLEQSSFSNIKLVLCIHVQVDKLNDRSQALVSRIAHGHYLNDVNHLINTTTEFIKPPECRARCLQQSSC